jgi:hypothetical protein
VWINLQHALKLWANLLLCLCNYLRQLLQPLCCCAAQ